MASTKKVNPQLETKSKSIVVPIGSANELNLERSIDLDPEDWYWATWRNLPPLSHPEPKPFDLQDCLKRLRKVKVQEYHFFWDWHKVKIDALLSREEAHFWFAAMVATRGNYPIPSSRDDLADRLSTQIFDGNISTEEIEKFCKSLEHNPHSYSLEAMILVNLVDFQKLIDIDEFIERKQPIVYGFRRLVLPYLDPIQIGKLRIFIRPLLKTKKWPTLAYQVDPPIVFFLAAALGMSDELLPLIESWEKTFNGDRHHVMYFQSPQKIVFGLKDPDLVVYHLKRLGLESISFEYIRAWLAHTEYSHLSEIRDAVLCVGEKQYVKSLLQIFSLVKAPEAARFMLELMLASKAPQIAKKWLEDNPAHAVAGLIPVATDKGKYREAAIDFLRLMQLKGYGEYIQTCCDKESPEIAAQLKSTFLDVGAKEYIKFDEETTPEWLRQSIASVEQPARKKRQQIAIDLLPPIVCGEYCLNYEQIEAVITALNQSTLESPHPLVITLKKHTDLTELATFAWNLFESWTLEGAPLKDGLWAINAIGLLGNDDSARKLLPLIKSWSSKTQHSRVKLGLASLHAIGSEVAVTLMNDLSQQYRFTGIQERASTYMNEIAQKRGMTSSQLADRLISDCSLDARGTRMFDFGDRQFWFVVSNDLTPMVKDTSHKLYSNLPKSNRKDDKEKAESAIADWKVLKQQVTEVFKIQSSRLEGAMTSKRRWEVTEFETLWVCHPLMNHLTQLIVWGGYDKGGHLIGTFHVTEDRTYADETDLTCELTRFDRIGIVHPDEFSSELLTIWGELMSDYKIVSPFVQLCRSICDRESQEKINT